MDICFEPSRPRSTDILLRPVRPDDAPDFQSLVRGLPPTDRRRRFHGAVNELPPDVLRAMTCVDQSRDFALVAASPCGRGLVADARWSLEAGGEAAEFAVMVHQGWRRRGLGARCIHELRRAASTRGVRRLHGSVLADNAPMLALLLHCGFAFGHDWRTPGLVIASSMLS